MTKKNPYLLDTVSNALAVLDCVAENGHSTLTQISEDLGINKTVVFRILYTLEAGGYVTKTETSAYTLGHRVMLHGQQALKHNALHQRVKGVLRDLTTRFNESSHMGLLDDNANVLIVSKIDAAATIQMSSQIGKSMPAYCSAMGKCLLAHMNPLQLKEYMNSAPFPKKTLTTLTTAKELERELGQIRERGYAIDNEESEEGLFCVAVPVANSRGKVYAAVSLSGPSSRMINKTSQIIRQLPLAAQEILRLEAEIPQ
ncbi:MAG: IclR family transcriptional regulator [Eubacteriales bacterium]|nr:IclR family transcriptional regulator [Eubacteriales bacterium]